MQYLVTKNGHEMILGQEKYEYVCMALAQVIAKKAYFENLNYAEAFRQLGYRFECFNLSNILANSEVGFTKDHYCLLETSSPFTHPIGQHLVADEDMYLEICKEVMYEEFDHSWSAVSKKIGELRQFAEILYQNNLTEQFFLRWSRGEAVGYNPMKVSLALKRIAKQIEAPDVATEIFKQNEEIVKDEDGNFRSLEDILNILSQLWNEVVK